MKCVIVSKIVLAKAFIYIYIYILYWHKSHLVKMFFRISQKKTKKFLTQKKEKRKAVLSQLNVE